MEIECSCGEGWYDDEDYSSCYQCYLERRRTYLSCIFCGRWHSPRYNTCFQCRRESPERDEAGRTLRLDILIRDNFKCQNCGAEDCQVDHIKPCARGGAAAPWNLQALCGHCNRDKGSQWRPGSTWDQKRVGLMHLYFTFGWGFLDDEQRKQLYIDAGIYDQEFVWHHHWKEFSDAGVDESLPEWVLAMADEG